ncbi:MAG TPA: hypothetical protein VGE67_02025, partial [Haloferula sp.]
MNNITNKYRGGVALAILSTALSLPVVEAALVGQGRGTDYVDGQNWTSTPATGSIVATINGTGATAVTDGYAAGTKAVDMPGAPY